MRAAVATPPKTGSLKISSNRPSQATGLQEKNIFFEVLRKSIPKDTTLFKPPILGGFRPATIAPEPDWIPRVI
jgi:hypothetical protein